MRIEVVTSTAMAPSVEESARTGQRAKASDYGYGSGGWAGTGAWQVRAVAAEDLLQVLDVDVEVVERRLQVVPLAVEQAAEEGAVA